MLQERNKTAKETQRTKVVYLERGKEGSSNQKVAWITEYILDLGDVYSRVNID